MVINIFAFLLSACAVLYGLMFIQAASVLVMNALFWWSVGFGVLVSAWGLGLVWGRRSGCGDRALVPLQIALALAGAASVTLAHLAFICSFFLGQKYGIGWGLGPFFLFFVLMTAAIGSLAGASTSGFARWKERSGEEVSSTGLLAAGLAGVLPAGWLFSAIIVPGEELVPVALWTGIVQLGILLFLVWEEGCAVKRRKRVSAGIVLLAGLLLFTVQRQQPLQQYLAKKEYFSFTGHSAANLFRVSKDWPDIAHYRSPYAGIDIYAVSPNPVDIWLHNAYSRKFADHPDYPWGYMLFFNHELQLDSEWDEFCREYFVDVPVALQGRVPKNVLVLGRGGRLLAKEILKYPGVKRVTVAGADPIMLALADQDPVFTAIGGKFLRDERVHVVDTGAFDFLRNDRGTYDAVFLDFPPPSGYGPARYYSLEFDRLVAARLAPDGFAVLAGNHISDLVPAPGGKEKPAPDNPWPVYDTTLRTAGFATVRPFMIDLEPDNPAAIGAVGAVLFGRDYFGPGCDPRVSSCLPAPDKAARARKMVAAFTRSMRQGFIFVKKDRLAPAGGFLPGTVKTEVLTPERMRRALALSRVLPQGVRENRVHSLLRPELPGFSARALFPF